MRVIQAIIFLAFLTAVAIFAVQNTNVVTVKYFNWVLSQPLALFTVAVYLLGMLTGWTVVAFVRRSIRRAGEEPRY